MMPVVPGQWWLSGGSSVVICCFTSLPLHSFGVMTSVSILGIRCCTGVVALPGLCSSFLFWWDDCVAAFHSLVYVQVAIVLESLFPPIIVHLWGAPKLWFHWFVSVSQGYHVGPGLLCQFLSLLCFHLHLIFHVVILVDNLARNTCSWSNCSPPVDDNSKFTGKRDGIDGMPGG